MPTLAFRPFGRETWRDPYPLYRALREDDPVHRSPSGVRVLTRFADVFDAARDTATFSSAQGPTFTNEVAELGLLPTIVMMDPPDHTRYRRLVNRGFTPRHVEELEPQLRAYVVERIEALRAAGGGDVVAALARPTPSWVVAHYLGVPLEDRGRIDEWTAALVQQGGDGAYGAVEALGELSAYFTELVARRRDDRGDRSMIPNAVDELLRLTSPVHGLCRVVTRDVTVRDTPPAAGDRVLLGYAAANRDPAEFGADADELDLGRTIPRMLTFSTGAHFCLGAAAARLQGRVVLEELLDRCPAFTVDAEAGVFADGAFTRRYGSLPFDPGPAAR